MKSLRLQIGLKLEQRLLYVVERKVDSRCYLNISNATLNETGFYGDIVHATKIQLIRIGITR